VRDPRPGIAWSRHRVARRGEYAAWMTSGAWLARRRAWQETWVALHGAEPDCAACGGPWSLRHGDLHHRSYERLGAERFSDLVPLDRACHDRVHAILESTPAWRRLGRVHATDVIVARLRAGIGRASGETSHG
jgi:hypothetical protein